MNLKGDSTEVIICDQLYKLKAYIEFMYGGKNAETEDIYSETLIVFWIHLRRGNFKLNGGSIYAYLKRCALSAYCNMYRRENKIKRQPDWYLFEMSTDGPERKYEQKAEVENIIKKMTILTKSQRQVFALKFIQNIGENEIGETLNMSRVAVASHVFKMRKRLGIEIR